MAVVLITGMSGAGKSSVLAALARRGHATVDTDLPGWIEVVDGEPLWREDRMTALLDAPRDVALFVVGTVANQGRFRDRFDAVVLLTAPEAVLLERVGRRTPPEYGSREADREALLRDVREVEPRLRAAASTVIDTRGALSAIADEVESIALRGSAATDLHPT